MYLGEQPVAEGEAVRNEAKTTIEKAQRVLERKQERQVEDDLRQQLWRLQSSTEDIIRFLCQEIDGLKAEIAALKGNK